jgi:S1-C subfamily serine protease
MLRRRIEDMDIGAEAKLAVVREGKPIEIAVTLDGSPDTAAEAKRAKDELLEYGVRELTYMDRVDRDLPLDQKGVIVASIENGGWANVAGLRAGDVILAIQDMPVESLEHFEKAVKQVAESKPKRVKIFVRRDVATAFVFVEPDWPRK